LKHFQTFKTDTKNSVENIVLQVLIDREFLSIDQMLFSIDRTGIEHRSK